MQIGQFFLVRFFYIFAKFNLLLLLAAVAADVEASALYQRSESLAILE